ncbi:hypothetical protein GJ496_012016 [Pomphorhynchus laevis]|nr:hypothetical protein GJ496_012016 [Pomphorhynchus laevis]
MTPAELRSLIAFQRDTFRLFGPTKKCTHPDSKIARAATKNRLGNNANNTLNDQHIFIHAKQNVSSLEELEVYEMKQLNSYLLRIKKSGWRLNEHFRQSTINGCTTHKCFSATTIDSQHVPLAPSVTQILEATKSERDRNILRQWRQRKLSEFDSFSAFMDYLQDIKKRGSTFHNKLCQYFTNKDNIIEIPNVLADEAQNGLLKSFKAVASYFPRPSILNEQYVCHKHLNYSGRIDCLLSPILHEKALFNYQLPFNNKLVLVDWKTTDSKVKHTILDCYDYPVQLAAYLGALKSTYSPDKYDIADRAILAFIYCNGSKCTLFRLNEIQMDYYWQTWLQRLIKFSKLLEQCE